MKTAISLEQAQHLLLEPVFAVGDHEDVPLLAAMGRVAFHTIGATMDQPPFHRSPLDGYALNHRDIMGAAHNTPITLPVCQTIHAGDFPQYPLALGEAARVMTGAPLPLGADCVIRQEDTETDTETDTEKVKVFVPLKEYQNFCFQGEDIKKGSVLIEKGTRLDGAAIGVLSGQGMKTAATYRCPKVCVISTGSELSEPGQPLEPGKIYDSNRMTLSARCQEIGAELVCGASVPDDPLVLAAAIEDALPAADLLITTGGVSVGDKDYMHSVGERLGGRKIFNGVDLKPGSPAFAMVCDDKMVICLSGNPFAAYATFELLAVPVIRKLAGIRDRDLLPKRVTGIMKSVFAKESRGRRFIRARMEGGNVFLPSEGHASGMLLALIGCNCLVDIPAGNKELRIDDQVEVLLF